MSDQHRSSQPRLFHGWWIVLTSIVGISVGPAPFAMASIGIFMSSFEAEFGWNRAEIGFALTLFMIATAISLPFVGRLVDSFGVKRILLPSLVALALGLLAIPTLVSTYWQFVLVFVVFGTFAAGGNSVPYMRTIGAWFDKSRGLAIGLAGSGTGLGFAYVPILVNALVENYGWRAGYYGLAAIILIIAIPMIALVLKVSPREMGLRPDGAIGPVDTYTSHESVGYVLTEVLRSRDFWLLAAIFVPLATVLYGLIPNLVPLLTDRGIDTTEAATIASLFGLSAFVGRVAIGFLVDRFFARLIAMVFFSISAAGIFLLATDTTGVAVYVAALLVGVSLGAEVDLLAYLTSRYFGLKSFAQIFGVLFAAIMMGMAFGPTIFGGVYELTGSYSGVLVVGGAFNIVAIIMTALLRPYPEFLLDAGTAE